MGVVAPEGHSGDGAAPARGGRLGGTSWSWLLERLRVGIASGAAEGGQGAVAAQLVAVEVADLRSQGSCHQPGPRPSRHPQPQLRTGFRMCV